MSMDSTVKHVVGVAGDRFGRFVKRYRVLYAPAGWVSRIVASSPSSSLIAFTLGPLRARLRGNMSANDVLWVLDALDGESLRFSLAGGWGVDALIGAQHRQHDDLDVIIDDYEHNEPKAQQALVKLGFKLVGSQRRRTWMPDLASFDDGAGHRVELVSIDWERLADALAASTSARPDDDLTARSSRRERSTGWSCRACPRGCNCCTTWVIPSKRRSNTTSSSCCPSSGLFTPSGHGGDSRTGLGP